MSTDRTHIHLLLDRIREEQYHQGATLQDITERQEEALKLLKGIFRLVRDRSCTRPSKIAALLSHATGTFAQCVASLLLLVYILKGGDIPTAVATLGKLFGMP
jgi:hypothetical protein